MGPPSVERFYNRGMLSEWSKDWTPKTETQRAQRKRRGHGDVTGFFECSVEAVIRFAVKWGGVRWAAED
jgi:hypothetical protein